MISVFRPPQYSPTPIFSAIQLLWINLVMNSFAALAFATDPPSEALLNRHPSRRDESIITPDMRRQILAQSLYQWTICFCIAVLGSDKFGLSTSANELTRLTSTFVFNVFVFSQIFNQINCRVLNKKLNVFEGYWKNPVSLLFLSLVVIAQVLIVQFGGDIFKTANGGLSILGWMYSVLFGCGSLVVGLVVRLVPSRRCD